MNTRNVFSQVFTELQSQLRSVTPSDEAAHAEARWILEKLLGQPWAKLRSWPPKQEIPEHLCHRLCIWLQRRIYRRVPLQYLFQEAPFFGLNPTVTPNVLIPRPETEQLVWAVLAQVDHFTSPLQIADIGTGSGAIALALKKTLRSRARVVATDISAKALSVALENAQRLNLKIDLRLGNGCYALPPNIQLDVLISNPPYIPWPEHADMQPEVFLHEPMEALSAAGSDPLLFYRHFAAQGADYLKPGGLLALECSSTTAHEVFSLFEQKPEWVDIKLTNDLSGFARFLTAWKMSESTIQP